MTWNVENLFAPQAADQAAYDTKLTELVNVTRTAAPDLLAVQEIGDEQSFEALRHRLGPGWTRVLSTHFETPHSDPRRLARQRVSVGRSCSRPIGSSGHGGGATSAGAGRWHCSATR